jgi:hypothetical protein
MNGDPASSSSSDDDPFTAAPEAWEPWETRLVVGSIAIGMIGLVVLGWLVDRFILP